MIDRSFSIVLQVPTTSSIAFAIDTIAREGGSSHAVPDPQLLVFDMDGVMTFSCGRQAVALGAYTEQPNVLRSWRHR